MPWETTGSHTAPLPVVAASALLRHSFGKPLAEDVKKLLGFYNDNGGFKATKETPEPDLLSTAVGLYALRVADYDMRTIKPDCLNFIDSLYTDGDSDPASWTELPTSNTHSTDYWHLDHLQTDYEQYLFNPEIP